MLRLLPRHPLREADPEKHASGSSDEVLQPGDLRVEALGNRPGIFEGPLLTIDPVEPIHPGHEDTTAIKGIDRPWAPFY